MRPLKVKGTLIGAGQPKTIVPIMDTVPELLSVSAADAINAGADLVEWRADFLDGLEDPNTLRIAAYAVAEAIPDTPVVATIRTKDQGGLVELDQKTYAKLIRTLINTEVMDIIDIEYSTIDERALDELIALAHAHHIMVVSSAHDFEGTPTVPSMVMLLTMMAQTGADIAKLAVYATSPIDALHLMEATTICGTKLDCPLITLAMGDEGKITRIAGEAFSSALTFCSLERSSAPGQIQLKDARNALDALHHAISSEARKEG